MNFMVRRATPDDAQVIIDFMDRVAGESNNLTFGTGEFPIRNASDEAELIRRQAANDGFMLLAVLQRSRKNGGPELVGYLTVDVGEHPRTRHRAEFTVAVSRVYWHQGVGRRLMEYAVSEVEANQEIEVLSCRVRSNNEHAIRLYEQFGLEATGTDRGLLKVDGGLVDATVMSRVFHRVAPTQGKPFFYLDNILEALDFANDEAIWYACLETGETCLAMEDGWLSDDDEAFDPDEAEGTWVELPNRFEIDDWGTMRDFADLQEAGLRNRLLNIIHHRSAYGNFRDECARCGMLSDYYVFRDRRHRRVAIAWLERNGCEWTEGRRP